MSRNPCILQFTVVAVLVAVVANASAQSLPLAHYNQDFGKGTPPYGGYLVGADPWGSLDQMFAPLNAVVIPLIVQIIGTDGSITTFDPTAPNHCDPGGQSAEEHVRNSPLVLNTDVTFNGTTIHNVQYINGFMKAQFWNATSLSRFVDDPIAWKFAAPMLLPPALPGTGLVQSTKPCDTEGTLSHAWLNAQLGVFITLLQAGGVISPSRLVVFMTKNVVLSNASPIKPGRTRGYHGAIGTTTGTQTYLYVDYDTTNRTAGVHDITTLSHELREWMNDPFLTNATPPWGNIGQVSSCKSNMEVGDPLTGTSVVIKMNGYEYHPQELAFFSWFFNGKDVPSVGLGGKFSSHSTFTGPSKICPQGGTFK